MRSAQEIRFRIWQQLENLRLLAFPPRLPGKVTVRSLPLPDPAPVAEKWRGTPYAAGVCTLADQVVSHRIPLLNRLIDTGPQIEWRKDYTSGRVTGTPYFRLVPYLDFAKAGDHKMIWELNRHQHLVLLAQAWLLEAKPEYLTELAGQLESWLKSNPFQRGINFASALEVAFRALSWLWIDHLVGSELPVPLRQKLRTALLQHGYHLCANLSTYFSPNTHLLGEGVALHALGLKFPHTGWEALGNRILAEERDRQIQPDGSHFEQSTYYHVYALDFFSFYYILAGRPAAFTEPLRKMKAFLAAVNGPSGALSFFGDDDGGRFFYPYGERDKFAQATLTTSAFLFPELTMPHGTDSYPEQAAWWLGCNQGLVTGAVSGDQAIVFPNSGLVSIVRGDLHVLIDTGAFGPGGAGHSHSDTLSLTARRGKRELLIDPGTFTYVADPVLRDQFRGSAFHSTLRINQKDQAEATRPFRWDNKPQVTRTEFLDTPEQVSVAAECACRGFVHQRRFVLVQDRVLFVLDRVTGPEGEHSIEQFWHLGPDAAGYLEILPEAVASAEPIMGWRSRCLGAKEQAPVLVYRWRAALPWMAGTALVFDPSERSRELLRHEYDGGVRLTVPGLASVEFPDQGPARVVPE